MGSLARAIPARRKVASTSPPAKRHRYSTLSRGVGKGRKGERRGRLILDDQKSLHLSVALSDCLTVFYPIFFPVWGDKMSTDICADFTSNFVGVA